MHPIELSHLPTQISSPANHLPHKARQTSQCR